MQINLLFPVIYPMLGGILTYIAGRKHKKIRDYLADFITISEFFVLLFLLFPFLQKGGTDWTQILHIKGFGGQGLYFQVDGFRALYGALGGGMWMVSTIFAREYFQKHRNRNRYTFFLLVTLGAVIGFFYSGDLFTTFLFFEIASFTSYMWVAQEETKSALKAAETYLGIAVIGGLLILMGMFLLYSAVGTLVISELTQACRAHVGDQRMVAAGVCLFFGFAAKAGAVPLHVWLPKAHPVAPAPASALLSGILTKLGIFGIIVVSCHIFYGDGKWGTFVLTIGTLTMITGAVLALLSVDIKGTLACSSVSQIGFIIIGIGMQCLLGSHNQIAARGTFLYMINHSLFKLVLFLVAGIIFANTHKLNLNDIRGFGRNKPWLHGIFLTAALGISGVPFFSGYISKTLIHESLVEYMHLLSNGGIEAILFGASAIKFIEVLFLLSGGVTLAYMTKLYVAIFVEKNEDNKIQEVFHKKQKYVTKLSCTFLSIAVAFFLIWGMAPYRTIEPIADIGQGFMNVTGTFSVPEYFAWSNLKGSLLSIFFGAVIYLLFVRKFLTKRNVKTGEAIYINPWHEAWDLENVVYRPFFKILDIAFSICFRFFDGLLDYVVVFLRQTVYRDSKLPHELEEGTPITHAVGVLLDDVKLVANRTIRKKKPIKISYEHKLALLNDEISENNMIIGRSLSFGLFMFGLGLVLTLIYMLWG